VGETQVIVRDQKTRHRKGKMLACCCVPLSMGGCRRYVRFDASDLRSKDCGNGSRARGRVFIRGNVSIERRRRLTPNKPVGANGLGQRRGVLPRNVGRILPGPCGCKRVDKPALPGPRPRQRGRLGAWPLLNRMRLWGAGIDEPWGDQSQFSLQQSAPRANFRVRGFLFNYSRGPPRAESIRFHGRTPRIDRGGGTRKRGAARKQKKKKIWPKSPKTKERRGPGPGRDRAISLFTVPIEFGTELYLFVVDAFSLRETREYTSLGKTRATSTWFRTMLHHIANCGTISSSAREGGGADRGTGPAPCEAGRAAWDFAL